MKFHDAKYRNFWQMEPGYTQLYWWASKGTVTSIIRTVHDPIAACDETCEHARVRKIELRLDVAPENHLVQRSRESRNVEFNWKAKRDEILLLLEFFVAIVKRLRLKIIYVVSFFLPVLYIIRWLKAS